MGKELFDAYTYLHFASGIIAFFWGISYINTLIVHTLFEFFENTLLGIRIIGDFEYWPGGKVTSDSLLNSIGDTVGVSLGWWTAYYIYEKLKKKK